MTYKSCIHGTLITHQEKGVLITGPAGIGKSTLAYYLLNFEFQLVADDAVILLRKAKDIIGFSPRKSRGLMMLDGLTYMSHPNAIKVIRPHTFICLIVHLTDAKQGLHSLSQTPTIVYQQLMGLSRPEVIMPLTPEKNIKQTVENFRMIFNQFDSVTGN